MKTSSRLELSGKTVLITGATGLIGSHIVDALMVLGDVKVIALSRSENKLKAGFAEYMDKPNFRYIAQDIAEPIQLPEGVAVDVIFHAAGPMENKIVANKPVNVIKPNLIGTMNCLELMRAQQESTGICGRLVLFSSVTIYGNMTDGDISVTETDTDVTERPDGASACYSQSKRMSEVIAHAYCKQYDLDVVIARLSTVYGDTRFKPDSAFFEFIGRAASGRDIIVNSAGGKRRDNIYIDDAVSALLCICQKGDNGQAYNISSNGDKGNFAAVDEIAQVIADEANAYYGNEYEVRVIYRQGSDKRSPGLRLDNAKLKTLGWELQTSLSVGVRHTLLANKRSSDR